MAIRDGKAKVRKWLRRARLAVLVPLLPVLAAGAPPDGPEAAEQEAQALFNRFTEERWLSSTERHALRRLSAAPEDVRKAFFDVLFSHADNEARFLAKKDPLLHATLGLNPEFRRDFLGQIIRQHCYLSSDLGFYRTCQYLLRQLPHLPETRGVPEVVAQRILAGMAATGDPCLLLDLSLELEALGERLPGGAAEQAAERIVDRISTSQNPDPPDLDVVVPLSHALEVLGGELPAQVAEKTAERIVEGMLATGDLARMAARSHALETLALTLSAAAAEQVAGPIVEGIAAARDLNQRAFLARALGTLAEKLGAGAAAKAAGPIVEGMAASQDPFQLSLLASGLAGMQEKLPAKVARKATARIVERMVDARRSVRLSSGSRRAAVGQLIPLQSLHLSRGLRVLLEKPSVGVAEELAVWSLERMAQPEDTLPESALGGVLAETLSAAMVRKAADLDGKVPPGRLWPAEGFLDPFHLSDLPRSPGCLRSRGSGLATEVALRLYTGDVRRQRDTSSWTWDGSGPPRNRLDVLREQARRIVSQFAGQVSRTYALATDMPERGLLALGEELGADLAVMVADDLVDRMHATVDRARLRRLARGLWALADRVPPGAVDRVAGRVVEAMAHPEVKAHYWVPIEGGMSQAPGSLADLESCLWTLGEKVPPGAAERVAVRIVEAMDAARDPKKLDALVPGLKEVAAKLGAGAAERIAGRLVEARDATQDMRRLDALVGFLAGLEERLPVDAVDRATSWIVEGPVFTETVEDFVQGLGEKLGADAAERAADRLIEMYAGPPEALVSRYHRPYPEPLIDSPRGLTTLARSLAALGEKLPAGAAERTANRIVEAMEASQDPDHLRDLMEDLVALREKLPADAVEKAATRIVEVVDATDDRRSVTPEGGKRNVMPLVLRLAELGEKLPTDRAAWAAMWIVDVLGAEAMDASLDLPWLVKGLVALGERLPASEAERAADRLLDRMTGSWCSEGMHDLVRSLAKLGKSLPASVAERAVDRLVEVMATTRECDGWPILGPVMAELGENFPAGAAERMAGRLVEALVLAPLTPPEGTAATRGLHPFYLGALADGLIALAESVDADAAERLAGRLVEAMEATTQGSERSFQLGRGLAALGEKLGADATQRSLQALFSGSQWPCGFAATLVRPDNLRPIIELLKSPSCSSWGRRQLIGKIGEVTGQTFGRKRDGGFRPDLWTFIMWAEKQGYQPGRPQAGLLAWGVPEMVQSLDGEAAGHLLPHDLEIARRRAAELRGDQR